MMNFVKKTMGIVCLLMLLILIFACKEDRAEPVADVEAVTVAFEMPVDASRVTVLPVPAEKEKKEPGRQDVKKASSVFPEPLPENSDAVPELTKYSGDGKLDPFAPLIKNKSVKMEEPVRRPRTPLEKLDYSQMKLVAIVTRCEDVVAMVEEAGGKGYIVFVGTYIGRNGGVVSDIWGDRIIVHERVKDFKGDVITRTQEIKLNKTEDERI